MTKEVILRFLNKDLSVNSVPMQPEISLNSADEDTKSEEFFKGEYRQAVGCLLYLACVSRPDIAYAVSKVAQYGNCPLKTHWTAVKGILRYLNGTQDWGITLSDSSDQRLKLHCSCDASFAGDTDFRFSPKTQLYVGGRRSHTGYVVWCGDSPVSWKSFRQARVALSSTEAEIIALVSACQEIIWLTEIMQWIDPECSTDPVKVEQDNTSSIHLVEKKTLRKRSRHYGKDYFFVSEKVEEGTITLVKQNTKQVIADALTKGLSKQDLHRHTPHLMSMENGSSLTIPKSSRTQGSADCESSNLGRLEQAGVDQSVGSRIGLGVEVPYKSWSIHAGG